MKKDIQKVQAIPSKRLYQSIIADYDTKLALCELIDNSLDIWVKNGKANKLKIKIDIDVEQQSLTICDNAGGIKEIDIIKVIAPGHTTSNNIDETIGVFGVGSKRAVVALAQEIKIFTRFNNEKTLVIEYNDNWLQQEEWEIEYYTHYKNIAECTTIIELSKLRSNIQTQLIEELIEHFGATYSKFLSNSNLSIEVNKETVTAGIFDSSWSYPPNYGPQKILFSVPLENENPINVEILAGLVGKDQIGEGEYGIYFYCNDRLILRADKSYDFGFTSGQAGLPHPQLNPMRVVVSLKGSPQRMPWNSSKSGINFKNKVFQAIRGKILELVIYYARLARKLVGNIEESIYQYSDGEINESKISDLTKPLKLYALPPPERKQDYAQQVAEWNKKLSNKKPWVIGLYEGVIMVESISHTSLIQRNRFALIMLDSTLEISFKEYLSHDAKPKIGKSKLLTLLQNRADVEKEIATRVKAITKSEWGLINHYYIMRNNLIHQIASSDVKIDDINNYRKVVESVLGKLFKIRFRS